MSCSDSDSPNKEQTVEGTDMGDVIGKEADEAETEEMSPEIPEIETERQDADGAPSNDSQGISLEDNQIYSCDESDGEEVVAKEDEAPCSCDACKDRRIIAENTIEEMRRLQAHWMDLRQYIRMVYRMAMEVKSPTEGCQEYIKEHVHKLCMCDPHQLFQRLESQVQEFVIETKVRQLELLKREKDSPVLPYLFISGLLDSYKKLMSAANELSPLLEQLQTEHLSKFNLTWKVLNQHLYQSCVYTDPFVQNKVPECIAKLSNSSPDPGDINKKLVREFLSFDDEITLVGSMWREAEARIHQYNQEQATLKAKQRMMKEDWEFFKAQRKFIHRKIWNKTNSGQFDDVSLGEEATCHRSCPCDECAMSHLLSCGGLVTPPHSPALPPNSEHGGRVEGEGREQTEPSSECECHVCVGPPATSPVLDLETAGAMNLYQHGSGFHLYPHIHGTGGVVGDNVANVYPHLYNIHSSLLANKHAESLDHKQQPGMSDSKPSSTLRPITPPVPPPKRPDPPLPASAAPTPPPAPPTTTAPMKVKGHRHSTTQTPAPRLHQTLPDVVPPSCHNHDAAHNKRLPCPATNKPTCHGHDHDDETTPEDSCSDRSSSTQRGDSRHCDCCYCEVFGHGVPSVAPVSRNYTEMRERLRLLLTKKKAKCKSSTTAPPPSSIPANTPTVNPTGVAPPVNSVAEQPKDPRDLEDLLDFIEGNPSQKCKDEKKAAKKARQKQKKQEEIERKKREEEEAERRRIEEEEAARALLKQQRKEAKKAKKKKKALEALAAAGGGKQEEQPQMVTIKRVMEPNSAEPTVTITLRGATPSEDKVLYTLLNGQVCQIPKDSNSSKNNQKGGKQQVQQNGQPNNTKSRNVLNNNSVVVNCNGVQGQSGKNNSKTKKENSSNQKTNQKMMVPSNQTKKEEPVAKPRPKPAPVAPPPTPVAPPPAPTPKLTSSTAIQINNAFNCLSSRQPLPSNFSLDSLKLPPGITITKVDPSQVTQQRKPPPQANKPPPPPIIPTPPPPMPAPSNVIVVDTGKLKDLTSAPSKDFTDEANGKKKKNKKKNGNGNQMNGNMNGMMEAPKNNMVRLTMNGGPPKRVMPPPQPVNGKVMMPPPQPVNGKVMMPPQAAIIKVNGSMVTIRSPALQQALNASNADQAKKKKKKKKGSGQGQQDESWNIDEDSVFAPKDIDLENGEMDDAERELEAFKRFCLQSVPPKQKETPTHLNIKDIVLKKKSSAISCS